MQTKLTWRRTAKDERYMEHIAVGTSHSTRNTFVVASYRNSYTGKWESHLQVHKDRQAHYLNQVPHSYGTIPGCKRAAQEINDREHEFNGY